MEINITSDANGRVVVTAMGDEDDVTKTVDLDLDLVKKIISQAENALGPEIVAGGVYEDQDGNFYIASHIFGLNDRIVYLWSLTFDAKNSRTGEKGAVYATERYWRIVKDRRFREHKTLADHHLKIFTTPPV